ncbi:MAG: hypothetical protein ACRDKH_03125 [Solirubrobacterales bacterium]
MDRKLLSIYLQDHMAGAVAGVELARRVAGSNRDRPDGDELAAICDEIESDREALSGVMGALDIGGNPVKQSSAWVGEKLGRLKLNGRLTGYSPLSRLLEIEGLILGVSGKLELWRSLRVVEGSEPRLKELNLRQLERRAEDQRARLERLHERAAANALA